MVWCDLLEAELRRGIEDIARIRELRTAQACELLSSDLQNAQYYLRSLLDPLEN
jgi:hypothetical protein